MLIQEANLEDDDDAVVDHDDVYAEIKDCLPLLLLLDDQERVPLLGLLSLLKGHALDLGSESVGSNHG